MVGAGDAGDVLVGQLAVGAVHHAAELAGVDEEHLAAAVAELAVLPVAREEPEAGRDLRRVEELARQRDHAVHEVGLDQVLADLALAGLVRRHRAVGEHEAGHARGRQVVDDVLHPGEVGVARRRHAVLPALVVAQALAAPVGDVEGRIGEDEVGLEVGWRSLWKVSPWAIWPSMPRMARFILASRQVV